MTFKKDLAHKFLKLNNILFSKSDKNIRNHLISIENSLNVTHFPKYLNRVYPDKSHENNSRITIARHHPTDRNKQNDSTPDKNINVTKAINSKTTVLHKVLEFTKT